MMKRFLTLNNLMHEQGLSAAALAEIRALGLAEIFLIVTLEAAGAR